MRNLVSIWPCCCVFEVLMKFGVKFRQKLLIPLVIVSANLKGQAQPHYVIDNLYVYYKAGHSLVNSYFLITFQVFIRTCLQRSPTAHATATTTLDRCKVGAMSRTGRWTPELDGSSPSSSRTCQYSVMCLSVMDCP